MEIFLKPILDEALIVSYLTENFILHNELFGITNLLSWGLLFPSYTFIYTSSVREYSTVKGIHYYIKIVESKTLYSLSFIQLQGEKARICT